MQKELPTSEVKQLEIDLVSARCVLGALLRFSLSVRWMRLDGGWIKSGGSFSQELLDSAESGNIDEVEKALNQEANVAGADGFGWTPLHFAAFAGSSRITEVLELTQPNIDAVFQPSTAPFVRSWGRRKSITKSSIAFTPRLTLISTFACTSGSFGKKC